MRLKHEPDMVEILSYMVGGREQKDKVFIRRNGKELVIPAEFIDRLLEYDITQECVTFVLYVTKGNLRYEEIS